MLNFTKRLEEGVKLLNNVDVGKLKGVVTRVCSTITNAKQQVFSNEEEDKLSTSLGLSLDQTRLLVSTIVHIIHQAGEGTIRPGVLEEHMIAAGLSKDGSEVISQLWATHARSIVNTLRQNTLAHKQLDGIEWSLQLETATSTRARQARPIALMQFSLASGGVYGGEREKMTVQMDQPQLYSFYQQLEQVQTQLDALR